MFDRKSEKVILKELQNEKEINDSNVPNATERIVSIVKFIAEAQDENSEVATETSSKTEEVGEK